MIVRMINIQYYKGLEQYLAHNESWTLVIIIIY